MVPLFSKADLNKFWHDGQNEVTYPSLPRVHKILLYYSAEKDHSVH